MAVSYAIEVKGLRKSFGAVPVLTSVDLRVERGTMLALLGPNGAGKTTTVRILTTLLAADGGTALVEGHDVARDPRAVRRLIGVTGQATAVDELLTGEENLEMMARLFGLRTRAARRRRAELLAEFGLEAVARRPVRTYSGGLRRRLDLAVGLINRPSVLFLDEPTTGLDPTSRATMWETVRRLLADGTTILLTTQYLEEADQLADRIAVIDGGRVVAEGTAARLKSRIGAERAELSFAAADLPLARRLFAGDWRGGDTLSVPVDGAADVRRLLNRAAESGAEVTGLALHRPSLDDVFAELTGAGVPAVRS
ncbi:MULTISPECIES: daunorubicin resistance protein DrrA family ABC transporter ATP-binding protein [Streptomyces]|uniref:ABC-type xenobiotic transporter n=1 Tax=Streptomyces tsukubensis (strain DSM 42081 / NBRC 108919 / NRRL 18488 / 9993) TaxID=1114943 RepID=I2N8D1_STRT9|nr:MULTISPECIES: daunorubicin resistance protein DrrA family ABC transporter ATP-binding protein [Streptomyces]AZK97160.1 daunorubicin resistance protein DrrA family ABC transporter ATP-binding protein [Streptomyces tsukubensis]EIF93278.1 daunorubicin resistance ABC transporter ATPase [Streptomyces tsukubensis NRRL18488]MYS68197.1 daunorubicin resistance protein DrrA family ABC transporter ATP-binding protein [Streptomyces sp. SID5473]QKM66872.1 daunorubicin resistance protein DrrA family ABC t